ncbi:MAG: 16S rRNA (cytidine(1402)-2'-O)-methyltransferase [Clostridia bacterium]|nr:16S rRNA (cytidine(1402)-2'-O)-methyltransferase [Clostridia bacterium]
MVYFVTTPIGNLDELTYRAHKVLQQVDCIFCEDTRHSQILLNHYDVKKPLYSFHKFNEKQQQNFVLQKAREGDVAIVSDAGTPCICDPGASLILELQQQGIEYTVVGSGCAFVSAFVLSGFCPPLTFCGFLPEKNGDKDKLLDSVNSKGCLAFYVSVHNLKSDLEYLYQKLGERKACLVKELTKMHEKVVHFSLSNPVLDDKGEFVLLIDKTDFNPLCQLSVLQHVAHYVDLGMSKNEAIKQTAKDRGVSKNEIYRQCV